MIENNNISPMQSDFEQIKKLEEAKSHGETGVLQNYLQDLTMNRIIIIDGGPRKNMNTAKLLQSFAEGAKSAGGDI